MYIIIGWHKSIVSSDWSDTMVWFGQILLYLSFTILYIWSLHQLLTEFIWSATVKSYNHCPHNSPKLVLIFPKLFLPPTLQLLIHHLSWREEWTVSRIGREGYVRKQASSSSSSSSLLNYWTKDNEFHLGGAADGWWRDLKIQHQQL